MILSTIVIAIALGIAAQIFAERVKIPAILPLLVFGILAGPNLWRLLGSDTLGLLDPSSLGHGLEVFIHLGIAVILFEGGLSLSPKQLQRVGSAVRNLLTLGVVITGLVSAWLFQAVTGMPWSTAALFGAIVTVTGPTVIVPLLRHMIVPRRVSTILVSEGLIIDPIGAVLAYLVLQAIERPELNFQSLGVELVYLAFIGSVMGFVAGALGNYVVRSRITGGEIRNLAILALLMLSYLISEEFAHQSGILAAVVMGLTMSAADVPDLVALKSFKGQLTVLLISVLFILLAAQLDLQAILNLGLGGLLVVAGLVLLVRPLSVFLSIMPSQLGWKERSVIALTAPRGIVAAAVASLAARQLTDKGIGGGPELEGMVYLTIILTVLWATVMAIVLPRILGYANDPSRRLIVMVGANPLSLGLARMFKQQGRAVAVIDASTRRLEPLRELGITAVRGDARDASSFEAAGVQRDTQVVALTTNDELNLLSAELVREEFGVEHPVVGLQRPSEEFGKVRRAWVDLLSGAAVDIQRWIRRFEMGHGQIVTIEPGKEGEARDHLQSLLEENRDRYVPVAGWSGDLPSFRFQDASETSYSRLTLLVAGEDLPEELERYLPRDDEDLEDPGLEPENRMVTHEEVQESLPEDVKRDEHDALAPDDEGGESVVGEGAEEMTAQELSEDRF